MNLSLVWTVLFYAWFAFEIVIAIVTRTRQGGDVRDRGTMALLWVVIVLSVSGAVWIGEARTPDMFDGGHWIKTLSLAVLAAGLLLRVAAVVNLGGAFSANVAIVAGQRVRQTGLYRWMRHPSYAGLEVIFLAIGLHTRNWIGLAVAFLPPTAALLYRIHVEEIALKAHFGEEYVEYCRRTKRLIPGIY
jgi:protein-S-isoprenylcysteine O-methyltransferase Ste14